MGLISWWPLNGTLDDYIGGNNLVAYNNFNSDNNGKIGKCYFASTTSSYAQSTNNIFIDGNLSLCFWFKATNVSDNPVGLVTLHDYSNTSNMGVNFGDNKLAVSIGYTDSDREWNTRKGTTTLATNTWYHTVLTYSKTDKKVCLYLNGVREYSGTLSKEIKIVAKKLTVNRWSVDYNGYMKPVYYNDIRLYNHELSAKEIKEISKAKMIHYNFNDAPQSNIVTDSSGLRNNLSVPSASPTFTCDDSGMGTSSFLFSNGAKQSSGTYQYLVSSSTIRIPESGTLSYFMKQSGTQNNDNHYAVGFQNFCTVNGFGGGNEVGLIYYQDSSSYTSKTSTAAVRDGKWHLYTITWSVNSNIKIYIDGTLIATHSITTMAHAGTYRSFYVGSAWSVDYGGFAGYLDDIRLYATQLSDSDIAELYSVKASVSKNGKLFANEVIETGLSKLTTKTAYNANWVRLFYHNNKSASVLFSSDKNELLRCNTTDKKSDLWMLERFRDKDGKFELLLEYDGISGYNRWKQTSNFTKTTSISGYEAVQISWTAQKWGGLALSEEMTNTWIDGSPKSGTSSWWYAIGCRNAHQGGIPGPGSITTSIVSLWVRTDTVPAVSIDKKGIVYTDEINEVDNTSMKTKTELNANWVRLFYHNNKSGTVLFSSDKNEFLKCNTGDKISDLWALEQFRGKDGKFELLLQYQSGGSSYNRWKQSSNFTKETISGYEAVQISWTSSYWGGLEPDNGNSTWVDGSVNHNNWYYAIGSRAVYNGGIPAWQNAETGWVELWVRCDDINLFRMIKGGKCKATEFIEI